MSRKKNFLQNSNPNTSEEPEDPFADDDLSLDIRDLSKNYGKRTGKFYQPKKWKRSPSGFMDYFNQSSENQSESVCSSKKLKKLRTELGLDNEQDSENNQLVFQSPSSQSQQNQPQPKIQVKKPPKFSEENSNHRPRQNSSRRQSSGFINTWQFSFHQEEPQIFSGSQSQSEQEKRNPKEINYADKSSQESDAASIQKSKDKISHDDKDSYKKKHQQKSFGKSLPKSNPKQQEHLTSDKKSLRKSRRKINYKDDFPKISMLKSKSKKKLNRSAKEKRKSQEKRWELQLKKQQQKKKSQNKRKSQQRKKRTQEKRRSEERRRSEQRRKQLQQRRFQQRKRSEQKKRDDQRKRLEQIKRKQKSRLQQQKLRKEQQKRKDEERALQKQRKRQERIRKQEEISKQALRKQIQKKKSEENREYEKKLKEEQKILQKQKRQLQKKKQQERQRQGQRKRSQEKGQFQKERKARQQQKKRIDSKHNLKPTKRGNSADDESHDKQRKDLKHKQRKSLKKQEEIKKQKKKQHLKNRLIPKKQKMQIDEETSYPGHQKQKKSKISSDEEDQLLDKYFDEDISQIKQKRRPSSGHHFSPNQSIRSFVQSIDRQNEGQSSDWLNKAIINTESENLNQYNTEIPSQFQNQNVFMKNKQNHIQSKKKKEINHSEKVLRKRSDYPLRNQYLQENLLPESLKKGAGQYYEKQQKEALSKNKKKSQEMKVSKRDRASFETIYTDDILDEERMQNFKTVQLNIKGNKKFKTNENKKDIKVTEQPQYLKYTSQQQSDEHEYLENKKTSAAQKKKIDERIAEDNRRRIREADKGLKKRDRPKRVSPKKKSKENVRQKSFSRPFLAKMDKKPQRNQSSDDVQIDGPSYRQESESSNSQNPESHRYPQRNRIARTKFWQQKVIYNAKREVIGVLTNEVHALVGWIPEASQGAMDVINVLTKGDLYIERIKISSKAVLEFVGFGESFQKLQLSLHKHRGNGDGLGKYIQVMHADKLQNLSQKVTVRPNTGRFTITNSLKQPGYVQMVLTINNNTVQEIQNVEDDDDLDY